MTQLAVRAAARHAGQHWSGSEPNRPGTIATTDPAPHNATRPRTVLRTAWSHVSLSSAVVPDSYTRGMAP